MHISLKCYATLAKYQPENHDSFPAAEGETIKDIIKKLGMKPDEVKIAFVNGKHCSQDVQLQDGDRVALFPAVGGG